MLLAQLLVNVSPTWMCVACVLQCAGIYICVYLCVLIDVCKRYVCVIVLVAMCCRGGILFFPPSSKSHLLSVYDLFLFFFCVCVWSLLCPLHFCMWCINFIAFSSHYLLLYLSMCNTWWQTLIWYMCFAYWICGICGICVVYPNLIKWDNFVNKQECLRRVSYVG